MSLLTVEFSPAVADIFVVGKASFKKTFTFNFDDSPIDFTDSELFGYISEYYNVEKKLDLNVTVFSDPTLGKINLELTPEQTSVLNRPRYVYSVFARKNTDIIKIASGQVLVELS